jgi:short-subunit dehydrogenase
MKMAVPVQIVGEVAVKKTLKGKMIIVPGTLSKTLSVVVRFFPRRWVAWFYYRFAK